MNLEKIMEAVKALDNLLSIELSKPGTDLLTKKATLEKPKPFLRLMTQKYGLDIIDDKKIVAVDRPLMVVSVRIVFMKIGSIDTIHDRFSADILVQSKWREPELDGTKFDASVVDWACYWNPRLSISNAIGEPKIQTDYRIAYDLQRRATVTEKQLITGQFFEFMELIKFPFDSQDLTISVTTDKDKTQVELREDEYEPCGANPDAFSSTQEWALGAKLNVWSRSTSKKVNGSIFLYQGLCAGAKVSRRPQFFLWNIVIILFAISSLAFSTFTVKMEQPESRMPLTFTLVLTTVTFKLVVNKNLPKVSYLTYMDKYILGTMTILVCLCAWHAVAGSMVYSINSTTTANVTLCPAYKAGVTRIATKTAILVDRIVLGIFVTVYTCFHLVYLVLIVCESTHQDNGRNEEVVENTESEMDMGPDSGDMLSPNRGKGGNSDKKRGDGAGHENNFAIAAFGD